MSRKEGERESTRNQREKEREQFKAEKTSLSTLRTVKRLEWWKEMEEVRTAEDKREEEMNMT